MSYQKLVASVNKESVLREILFNIDHSTEGFIVLDKDLAREVPGYYNILSSEYKNNGNMEFYDGNVDRDYGVIDENKVFSYASDFNMITEENERKAKNIRDDINQKADGKRDSGLVKMPSFNQIRSSSNKIAKEFGEEYIEILKQNKEKDIVNLLILTGASNDVLLYDLCKWAENIGLCSKARASRAKTEVTDKTHMVKTENVPIDVGRPRLKLMIKDKFDIEDAIEDLG